MVTPKEETVRIAVVPDKRDIGVSGSEFKVAALFADDLFGVVVIRRCVDVSAIDSMVILK